jgi:hypothetical protein
MSLGGSEDCNPSAWEDLFDFGRNELQDAIGEAWGANVVLVAAARFTMLHDSPIGN